MRPARPDFLAGNTRLRARRPHLLRLAGEADSRVRRAEGRALLRGVIGAFSHSARPVIAVLLARHDLADVLALLRGALRGHPPEDRLAAVQAVGSVTPAAAADVALAADGAAAVARLRALRLPDSDLADSLERAWTRYELHADSEELETDLAGVEHAGWHTRLAGYGRAARPVSELLAEERDEANLLTVLRVPPREQPALLPYGRLGPAPLARAATGDFQPVFRSRPGWRPFLAPLGPHPDPVAVEQAVRAARRQRGRRLLDRGDVFTAEVAVGYVLCAEDPRDWRTP